jgi:cytochrome P450
MNAVCPVEDNFLFPTEQPCPFDLYRQLREQAPVMWSAQMQCFVVSTYELISEVIRDTHIFSSRGTQNLIVNADAAEQIEAIRATGYPTVPFLVTNDPPDHGAYRKMIGKLFDARRMRAMQVQVDALIGQLYADFAANGGGEFMSAVATPLPVMVVADLLGVPSSDWRIFRAWGDAYVAPMNGVITPDREIECARQLRDYQDYFVAAIEERRANPRDDLISELVHTPLTGHDRTLDIPELLSAIQQFLVAGGETTTYALGSGMLLLAQQPDLAEALRHDPKRLQTFVEEVLRLRSPTQGIYRLTVQDTILGGVAIPRGSFVNIRLAAANRDETVFGEADQLDIDRANSARHIAFGSGIHTCMGAQLARIELVSAFQQFLAQADLALDEAAGGFAYFPSTFFMGLDHLFLTLTPRAA